MQEVSLLKLDQRQAPTVCCRRRDDARAVLLSMAAELGPDYLPFVIDVLQSALPNRGYTAHVLGFTLHSVLAAVARVRWRLSLAPHV